MFTDIPLSFKDKNEDYLIIGKLQEFCKENKLPTSLDKVDLINYIVNFAKSEKDNSEKLMLWLDNTLKEGVKKIILTKVERIGYLKNKSIEEWETLIKSAFNIEVSSHIIDTTHSPNLKVCGYKFSETNGRVDIVSLNFTILLKEKKQKDLPYNTIIYPVFVDIYLKEGYMVGRGKSKSSLFKFQEIEDEETMYNSVNYEKLIKEAFEIIYSKLNIRNESVPSNMHRFKSAIHLIVDECTKTPKEIVEKLNKEEIYRETFIKDFFKRESINHLTNENYLEALEDLKIFMEKYISITSEDEKIFITDRYAYPIQISATDSDFSSLEESSLETTPLQCTPIFFDNKRLIQKEKKCDNVSFMFKRKPKTYFTNKLFPVIIEVKRGYMHIDFRKYVLEEDIKNVLSRIIRCN
ncbi:hypothetical protein FDF74_04555 [Clostridium niameyense]|uniref:Uncharacterized protein n=1 Tax=Clostridium niameyense TaxID=1622073 RepID=A0A6M0R8E5_9CLOT|nr:hypothetical protein [Clostridium niameyense]NEZ46486.1 hypothetical protein [Clostridium niameyense]